MLFIESIRCSKCGREYSIDDNPIMCINRDLGRLDFFYDYGRVGRVLDRDEISRRPMSGVWRYAELMPVEAKYAPRLVEGGTPVIHAKNLGGELGFRSLYLKDETRNPTASFKDRAMALGVAKAFEMQKNDVVIASSGNAASSLAAYAASLGLRCTAFVPENVSEGKTAQLLLFGARVIRVRQVEEGKDPTVEMMMKTVEELGWYPCPSFGPFNPYQVEGPKTITYETIEQLNWKPPDVILVPTGSGCLLTGLWKGLQDLKQLGIIDSYPKLVPVQPEGNKPLIRAIRENKRFEEIEPEKWPHSIASGLLDPYPWDGDAALEAVRRTNGTGIAVSDDEITEAVKLLARKEGIFAEPSGAVGVAAAAKMKEEGIIDASDDVVILVTGSGLKESEKITKLYQKTPVIEPTVDQLMKYIKS